MLQEDYDDFDSLRLVNNSITLTLVSSTLKRSNCQ
jgi:hypothetical protein